MEIRNLKTFIQVCENNSFSKAAIHLGYTQSTITAQINQLENELGVPLFDRRGKTFQINEKGKELLDYANKIVALSEEAAFAITDNDIPEGTLRIGVIESIGSYVLPDILEKYMLSYPQVKIEVITAKTLVIMDYLKRNLVDLILTLDDMLYNPDWQLSFAQKEPIVFLCSPSHPFARKKDLPFSTVLKEKFILTEKRCNYRLAFEKYCESQNILPQSSLEIGNTATILNFTEKNIGLTFLPEVTTKQMLEKGRLAVFSIKDLELNMYIQLYHKKNRWCSPAIKAFEKIAAEILCL